MIQAQITDLELKEILNKLPKDEMAIFVMAKGRIRGALFHGTRFVNQVRAQHNLGILETMILGQAALCGVLLLPTMKGREHLTWRYETEGVAQGFSIEADSTGYVRGYLFTDNVPVDKPLENWNLAPFLGKGTMTMATRHIGDKTPYTSSIQIEGKSIAEDLAEYFLQSEQIQTAFNTSIQMDKKGRVIGAGGLFIQIMPETGGALNNGANLSSEADSALDSELITKIENSVKTMQSLGPLYSEGKTNQELLSNLFGEFNPSIALVRDVRFDCPCSKDTYLAHIRALPQNELQDIKKNGPDPLEIICRNCSSVYHIPVAEL